jgi:putative Mg2+ transporter-C (MgtC) family protein
MIPVSLHLELLLKLLLAVLLGGTVGLERELCGKPAGLRTNILICVGAALCATLSLQIAGGRGDPARIAAQILPGIGFIGAGTILHMRGSVSGLTTAATIWIVAAIGMALGASAYVEAIGTTVLVVSVLAGLGYVEPLIARKLTRGRLIVHARSETAAFDELAEMIRHNGLEIKESAHRHDGREQVIEFDLRGPKRRHDQAVSAVVQHPAVRSVSTGK